MAYVELPCDAEEWPEQKNVFIMLSHLRSLDAMKLYVSSYTRPEAAPSVTTKCLSSLRGLMAFLTDKCSAEEQNVFTTKTLPYIAKNAALLEDRVPISGLPFLEKQENSSLVLGRKVVLSLLSNAFLSTFPGAFNFKSFFDIFLEDNQERQEVQTAKLRAILCYFRRAAEGSCDLSGVITYRRKVLERNDLPTLDAWSGNPLPLCPLMVDNKLRIESSGGQTLQVCFSSSAPGGEVLQAGCSMEEVRFCVSPEGLLVKLVMDSLEPNEVIIVTGTERFANCSGSHNSLQFVGNLVDDSECDVFGNMLNSFVALDANVVAPSKPHLQYQPTALLRELNKAYTGFFCQDDRGDINTEKLTLSVKRGSLAFAAENYPACTTHMNAKSIPTQEENCAIGHTQQGKLIQSHMPQLKISTLHLEVDAGEEVGGVPLSPIPESCESPSNFQAALVGNILMGGVQQFASGVKKSVPPVQAKEADSKGENGETLRGGIEEFAARMASNLVAEGDQFVGRRDILTPSPIPPIADESDGRDALASHLAATIINSSLGEWMQLQAWVKERDENRKNVAITTNEEGNLEEMSTNLAKTIISEELLRGNSVANGLSKDTFDGSIESTVEIETTMGDATAALASQLAGSIMSEAVKTSASFKVAPSTTTYPPIVLKEDRRGSIDSFKSSRSSSLTGQSITVLDYTEEVAEEVVRDGLSIAQFMIQGMQGQRDDEDGQDVIDEVKTEEEEETEYDVLAGDMAYEVLQDGIDMFTNCTSPLHVSKYDVQQPREITPSFPDPSSLTEQKSKSPLPKRSLLVNISEGPCNPNQVPAVGDCEPELPMMASNLAGGPPAPATTPMTQRLLTPMSSRAGYAWSTTSTQDEESRPVSPMDMNKLGLSLSNNTEEFSSLVSEMVISHAIGDATGSKEASLSPRNIETEDNPSFTSSSKIGIYLSQLNQAEPPCDASLVDDASEGYSASTTAGMSSFSSLWDRMRLQLLRPITTGNWGCGPSGGADPQLRAMVQWVAASACGRPLVIYCTTSEERVKQLSNVVTHLRSSGITVGKLCQSLSAFSHSRSKGINGPDLFATLLQL